MKSTKTGKINLALRDFIKKIYFRLSGAKNAIARMVFILKYYSKKFFWKFSKRLPEIKKIHTQSYPALHFRQDRLDFALKFSSETLVLLMGVSLAVFNFVFFHLKNEDRSHAAKFLSQHPSLNLKLYAKNSSIVTVVPKQASFFTQAQAQNEEYFSNTYFAETGTENFQPDEETLLNIPPDSVDVLISKQIRVYQTKAGDTLSSIAAENNISKDTIIWANKLPSASIKPGWFLILLPTSGVLHKVGANDTLPDIAKFYRADMETIISYNGLSSAEDIEPGQALIVPGGKMPEPPKPKAAPKPSKKIRSSDGKIRAWGVERPDIVDNGTGHTFPWGYCTWYVASRRHIPWGGNAKNWLANSKAYGAVISNSATVGAIVVTTDDRRFGHVAFVESVSEAGFTVSEMNYKKFGTVNTRFIPHGSKIIRGFILP